MGRDLIIETATHSDQRDQAVAFMNAGHALMLRGDLEDLQSAVSNYTRAIRILAPIAKNSSYANSLGAAYLNRGQLLHALDGPASNEAIQDFGKATSTLVPYLDDSNLWIRRNYVGALVNHANLLLDLHRYKEAEQLATLAYHTIHPHEKRDAIDAQLSLQACRSLCDSIGNLLPTYQASNQSDLATEASEYIDSALTLIRTQRQSNQPEPYPEISERLFRFGAILYALHQPHFLEEFLAEHLSSLADAHLRSTFHEIASESIRTAVDTISKKITNPNIELEAQDTLRVQAEALQHFHQSL